VAEALYQDVFDAVSVKILEYEPGDLLLLSSIHDDLAQLRMLSLVPEITDPLMNTLVCLLEKEIKGINHDSSIPYLTTGLDLCATIFREAEAMIDTHDALPQFLQDAILDLINKLPSNCNNPDTNTPGSETPESPVSTSLQEKHNAEIFRTFIHESGERLSRSQSLIIELEKNTSPDGPVNELFRIFHTIKGECGFLRLIQAGELAHKLENILDRIRSEQLTIEPGVIDLLLESVDLIADILAHTRADNTNTAPNPRANIMVARIESCLNGTSPPIGHIMLDRGIMDEAQVQTILGQQKEIGFSRKFGELSVEAGYVEPAIVEEILSSKPQNPKSETDSLVKVKASQIQYLTDMIGELTIALSQLDDNDRNTLQSRKIARNLQLASMQLGTIRIGTLFNTMRRVVREASRQTGKTVELVLQGEDLEVDRTLVESLGEPLMHLIRNSIGHGIESAQDRTKAGKHAHGTVLLSSERRGHHVFIGIHDDGKGLQTKQILEKAIERGLVAKADADKLGIKEIHDFIFQPGFSTAKELDQISGRGVGMDIVKSFVESLRGTITINSQAGQFTEIILAFPINMAIIDGMIVNICQQPYIIPVSTIIESIELHETMFHRVQDNISIISLRGETIPVVDTALQLEIKAPDCPQPGRVLAVIVENHGGKYAFLVDEIVAKREIVIKPMGKLFTKQKNISSACILHGGKIGLVLDIDTILRQTEKP